MRFPYSPIPKSRPWPVVCLAASLPLINALFWSMVDLVQKHEALSQIPFGQALPPMFATGPAIVITGAACLLDYAIALLLLIMRRRYFVFAYGSASILRVSIWGTQIFNYDFPGIIGYFLLAVDTAVLFAGLHWYQDRKAGGDRSCNEGSSRAERYGS